MALFKIVYRGIAPSMVDNSLNIEDLKCEEDLVDSSFITSTKMFFSKFF